jgi:hypothetical protein
LRGKSGWLQHCTPAHDTLSTVVHEANKFDLTFVDGHRDCLYRNFSPLKYDLPFFYGLFGKHMLIVMFDRSENIRFSHSPSGGGFNKDAETTNPAWDFQFIIPKYDVMKEYGFSDVHIERFPLGGKQWDGEMAELWVTEPGPPQLISRYRDVPTTLATGSRSGDVTAELVYAGRGDTADDYKGKDVSLKQIGTELGVANVLEGSVRKQGERGD